MVEKTKPIGIGTIASKSVELVDSGGQVCLAYLEVGFLFCLQRLRSAVEVGKLNERKHSSGRADYGFGQVRLVIGPVEAVERLLYDGDVN